MKSSSTPYSMRARMRYGATCFAAQRLMYVSASDMSYVRLIYVLCSSRDCMRLHGMCRNTHMYFACALHYVCVALCHFLLDHVSNCDVCVTCYECCVIYSILKAPASCNTSMSALGHQCWFSHEDVTQCCTRHRAVYVLGGSCPSNAKR